MTELAARPNTPSTFAPPIGRLAFVGWGLALFAAKFAVDHSVARFVFGRGWAPWDYLVTSVPLSSLINFTNDVTFHLTLLAIAVPFIVVGVVLTLGRLRTAGLPAALAILFFLPVLNLLFFVLLAFSPSVPVARKTDDPARPDNPPITPNAPAAPVLGYGTDGAADGAPFRWMPENGVASFWLAALLPVPFGLGLTYLAVNVFRDYGWGVFVALPFTQGLIAATLHGMRRERSAAQSISVAVTCGVLTAIAMLLFGAEGLGCLIMLMPLAIPVMMIGGAAGAALQRQRYGAFGGAARGRVWSVALAVPLLMGIEHGAKPTAPVYEVTTTVDVDAPPAAVWANVVSFGRIAPPAGDDWLFRAGVAYPVEATIDGRGPGAVRRCVFSTGAFVEPITTWDEARLLKFDVTQNPPAMREWSFYDDLHPPHVSNFLQSHGGQFRLTPLGGGRRTRLEGTTWYEHNLWPAGYWRLWSDHIIHRIHGRVLNHVKGLSESTNAQPRSGDRM